MIQSLEMFKKYIPLLKELVSRDIKVRYRRSALGLIWSLLNPLLTMLVITMVFSTVFRFDIPNFPVYYLCGSVLFGFFSEATSGAMTSIIESASLIKKVYLPKYLFVLEKVMFAFVNLLFSLIAVVFIILITRVEITWTIVFVPILLVFISLFATGIGLILTVLATFFRDMMHLYSVVLTMLMYLTPIFYPMDILPDNFRAYVEMNPLYHYISFMRQCVLYGEIPASETMLWCFIWAISSMVVGLVVFKKNQNKFVLYI